MIQKLLCAAVLCICFSGRGVAQQNAADQSASKEDVERYFQAMHSREMITKIMDAMAKPMHEMIHQDYLKNQDKLPADFEARMNKRMDEVFKGFPWDDYLAAMVPVYQKHLTRGDIDALVTFYATPTGQKLLRELPAISAESMQQIMPMLQKSMEAMTKELQADIAAMMKESKGPAADTQKNE